GPLEYDVGAFIVGTLFICLLGLGASALRFYRSRGEEPLQSCGTGCLTGAGTLALYTIITDLWRRKFESGNLAFRGFAVAVGLWAIVGSILWLAGWQRM